MKILKVISLICSSIDFRTNEFSFLMMKCWKMVDTLGFTCLPDWLTPLAELFLATQDYFGTRGLSLPHLCLANTI